MDLQKEEEDKSIPQGTTNWAKLSKTTIVVLWNWRKGVQQIEKHLLKKSHLTLCRNYGCLRHFILWFLPFPSPCPVPLPGSSGEGHTVKITNFATRADWLDLSRAQKSPHTQESCHRSTLRWSEVGILVARNRPAN